MINGAHIVLYSKDAEADRAFLRAILGFRSVDAGHGWLIFALPDSEAAVHPAADNDRHELFLMCARINEEVAQLRDKGVECDDIIEQAWGSLTRIHLPGGGRLGLYEPKHPRP